MKPRIVSRSERGEGPLLDPRERKRLKEELSNKTAKQIRKDLDKEYQIPKPKRKNPLPRRKDDVFYVHPTDDLEPFRPKRKKGLEGMSREEMKKLRRLQQIKKDRNRSLTPAQAKELKRLLELR